MKRIINWFRFYSEKQLKEAERQHREECKKELRILADRLYYSQKDVGKRL